MLFYRRPAQLHFIPKAVLGQAHTPAVVIHKAGSAVQVGMAVPANAVLILQEFLRILRGRVILIQGSNSQFSPGETGTTPQGVINFFIRNRKRRGGCLCVWFCMGLCRFIRDFINGGNLVCLIRDQEGKLLGVLLLAQA